MSNDTTNAPAAAGPGLSEQLGLLNRLHSLKVLLGTDSPEVRGWAPVVQQEAQRTVNAAIEAFADLNAMAERLEATSRRVADENERLAAELRGAHTLFAPLCRDATALNWLDRAEALLAEVQA